MSESKTTKQRLDEVRRRHERFDPVLAVIALILAGVVVALVRMGGL